MPFILLDFQIVYSTIEEQQFLFLIRLYYLENQFII